jgi:hypothetical protein
VRFVEYGD